ncbi:MAG: hypothetical protein ACK4IK_03495 [Bacteroidia bacterium]
MIKNKKSLLIFYFVLPLVGFAQFKDTNNRDIKKFLNKWGQATYISLNDNINDVISAGADSLSVMKNTLPIFQNYITHSRSECFNLYYEKGYIPFGNLYSSNLLIIEILREDDYNTKIMHVINVKEKKKYSFVRSCMTESKTNVYEEIVSDSLLVLIEDFNAGFIYKEGWRSYTGIITYIIDGKFKCIPLLYLSDDDIEKLNNYGVGLK